LPSFTKRTTSALVQVAIDQLLFLRQSPQI
jgi:hypothetical protein